MRATTLASLLSLALLLASTAAAEVPGVTSVSGADPRAAAMAACKPDLQRLCASAGRDRKAIRHCIKANRSELSADCRGALKAAKTGRKGASAPVN